MAHSTTRPHAGHSSGGDHSGPRPSVVVPDLPGFDLCPDPLATGTPAELITALRRYWIWAGRPSYRTMARRAGQRFVAATLHAALTGTTLPGLDKIVAIIDGCYGTTEHLQAFATAWRRFSSTAQRSAGSRK